MRPYQKDMEPPMSVEAYLGMGCISPATGAFTKDAEGHPSENVVSYVSDSLELLGECHKSIERILSTLRGASVAVDGSNKPVPESPLSLVDACRAMKADTSRLLRRLVDVGEVLSGGRPEDCDVR